MRRSLAYLTAIGLSVVGLQAASAADMGVPLKSPPPAPVPYSWTGFYFGVNGGAGSGTNEASFNIGSFLASFPIPGVGFTLPFPSQTFTGFLGGAQAGYNWQTGVFVLGIEGDFDGAFLQGNTACILVFNCNVKQDWVADITARVGVVAFDKALVYVKGGAAWTDVKYSVGNSLHLPFGPPGGVTLAANASGTDTPVGGLLGMGIEYGFLPNWSAKIEYNFIDFGSFNEGLGITCGITPGPKCPAGLPAAPFQFKETLQIMKAGVNYRF